MIIETRQHRLHKPNKLAEDAPPGRRGRLLTFACLGYLAIVVSAWLFLRAEGDRWWPATVLLVCPRWPFALPAAVLWVGVLSARRWILLPVVAAATAVLLGAFIGLRLSLPAASSDRGDLRLLTCNIHRNQVDVEQLGQVIRSARPDVVVLQDWASSAGQDSLFAGDVWHVRRDGQLLIASRFPISKITPVDFGSAADGPADERAAAACYDLQTPAGPIRLVNVHLSSPHGGLLTFLDDHGTALEDNADRRWQESAALSRAVERSASPVLLAGDFNTTDDSPIFREDWADFRDAFTDCGLGIGYTYVNRHTQLRIDHILAGADWQIVRCWVGPAAGSPHRPLLADLRIR